MNTQTDQDTSCFRCSFFVLFWLFWLFFCCCCFFLCQINSSRVFNNSEAVFELEITSLIFSVSSHHQGRTDRPSLLKWHFSAHIFKLCHLTTFHFGTRSIGSHQDELYDVLRAAALPAQTSAHFIARCTLIPRWLLHVTNLTSALV